MEWFRTLSPVMQALLATIGTWLVTALGASVVFVAKKPSQRLMDAALGMASGVMLAASFWSLLAPAIEISATRYGETWKWVPPLVGFLGGAIALRLIDFVLPHLHPGLSVPEGTKTSWQRSTLLVLAITLHNIPEGLAVGVAFGAAPGMLLAAQGGASVGDPLMAAVALAVGIGLQNFPEGAAVALPLRREGMSRSRSFWYGQLSAIVEPVGGVVGAALVLSMAAILPYALAFAAGAMVFVVVEELIPESQSNGNVDLATMGSIGGFALMMVLDVALG